ncbi:MAG: hypothetical protein KatS3mg039_0165 [Candidatus Kapaibacterium sp.]|nr:MAG: hypothetical protein KatS3mg039_0165 [Candidatus Kapabacteria bacterium]
MWFSHSKQVVVMSVLGMLLSACATERVLVRGRALDRAALDSLNNLLASSEVELHLRGGAALPPALQVQRRYLLGQDTLIGIGKQDTVVLPLEYVAELRGTHRRSASRLLIGGVGGGLVGTALGLLIAPSAPLAFGIGGMIVGITAAALSSEQIVIRFEYPPSERRP